MRRAEALLALVLGATGAAFAVVSAPQPETLRQVVTRIERPRSAPPPPAEVRRPAPARRFAAVRWRRSTSVGLPWAGRLVHGVQLPPAGPHFFTWDPLLKLRPNRAGRRWATDRVLRVVLHIVDAYADDHRGAPRVAIGDLSKRGGGRFGLLHASHQNGLDVDVYYPRLDGLERPPTRTGQVDWALAQDLVDRFVRAGATRVFVGPNTGLRGPRRVVQVLGHHDNHLHARFGPAR